MSDGERHFDDELQEALDGRLTGPARAALGAHVADCTRCQSRLEILTAAKAATARLRVDDLPADVYARIIEAVRREPPAGAERPAPASARRGAEDPVRRRWVWSVVAAAVVALAFWITWSIREPATVPALAATDYTAVRDGRVRLEVRSTDVAEVEAFFRRAGIGFPTRVFDLAMMQFTVEGGLVHRLGQTTAALFVYRGRDSAVVVCQMYRGRIADLPATGARRTHHDIEFLSYDERGVTVVFWQEGDVVCVIAGEGNAEQIFQLAFAKAVKV